MISAVEDNEVRSEEDSTSKQAHVNLVNKQPSGFRFHQVLRCFRVVTDELFKVNSALKPMFSVIEDQCSGGQ